MISSLDNLTVAVAQIGTRPAGVSMNGNPDTVVARADAERHLQAHHQREREQEEREIMSEWGDFDNFDDY